MHTIYKWYFEDYLTEFKAIQDLIAINRLKAKWNYYGWTHWKSGVWIDAAYYSFWQVQTHIKDSRSRDGDCKEG